jgi:hypothetical protein
VDRRGYEEGLEGGLPARVNFGLPGTWHQSPMASVFLTRLRWITLERGVLRGAAKAR